MEWSGAQLLVFPFLLLVLPMVAALAWWLKHRYTAAVVRLQTEAGSVERAQADIAGATEAASTGFAERVPASRPRVPRAREVPSHLAEGLCGAVHLRLRRRVLSLELASGQLYWLALVLLMAAVMAGSTNPVRVLVFAGAPMLLLVFAPAVIAWALQTGVRHALVNVPAVLMVVVALALQASEGGWESELGASFGYASVAVAVSVFLRPSVRGAGLPLMTAAGLAWLVFAGLFAIALAFDDSEDTATSAADVLGGVVVLMLVVGAAVWCGWRALMVLARQYSAKRFSDMQLALGMYWALLTAFTVATLLKDRTYLALRGMNAELVSIAIVLLWLLWRRLHSAALAAVVRRAAPAAGTLLFLRVFKPSRRSEQFTDRFFAYWRFAGPVWMIAGPDLAGAYMEPTEFFAYIRRRLREYFVADAGEVVPRLEALDNARDPDGRFRINELLCSNDTWQAVVLHMIARADVILLDLREYSQRRRGTRFELTELLRRAPLEKVLLMIDTKDDVTPLTGEIVSIWHEVARTRSIAGELGELQILRFGDGSAAEMLGLVSASVGAANRCPKQATGKEITL
jgi:hypothetical protein